MSSAKAVLPVRVADPMELRASARSALVVDDDVTNRLVLHSLLARMGFEVREAGDGREAVARFAEQAPDIVFMDVMMPCLDGIEATRAIKARCGDEFVPVIFLTAMSEDEVLARCLEAGGDDFLSKPYNHEILKAKIGAIGRIRDLHRRMRTLYTIQQRDEEVAEQVFACAVTSGNLHSPCVRSLSRPAAIFSGDVMLSARAPSGDVHLLVGDFTGHGIAAAVGALPASETFRAMTAKGFAIDQILEAINRKLSSLLPTGMFMGTVIASFDCDLDHVTICNCGMPDAVVLDAASGRIAHRVASSTFALGVSPDVDFAHLVEYVPIGAGDVVLLASDGVTECASPDGEAFGRGRFERAAQAGPGAGALARVTEALDRFCRDQEHEDDVTLVEVEYGPALFSDESATEAGAAARAGAPVRAGGDWEVTVRLRGARLCDVDPVPLLMSQVQEFEGPNGPRATLFTVLSELYVNALDHGVLGLESSLKRGTDGFQRYLEARQERLGAVPDDGEVRISIGARAEDGEVLRIRVEDSGTGFDVESALDARDGRALHGRGLRLVSRLCERVAFEPPGNRIEVHYPARRGRG